MSSDILDYFVNIAGTAFCGIVALLNSIISLP